MQADGRETERRDLARVGQPGDAPAVQRLRDWMAEEMPLLAGQRPWERANLLACGTPHTGAVAAEMSEARTSASGTQKRTVCMGGSGAPPVL